MSRISSHVMSLVTWLWPGHAAEPQAEEAAVAAWLGLPRRHGVLYPLAPRRVDSASVRHAGQEQDGFS